MLLFAGSNDFEIYNTHFEFLYKLQSGKKEREIGAAETNERVHYYRWGYKTWLLILYFLRTQGKSMIKA